MKITNLQEAKEIEIRQLQEKSFEILLYLKNFCDKYNIRFFLIGGSCIGALRHQGFIPWDDDIDVMMLREEYERFHILWEKYGDHKNYSLCRTSKEKNYHQPTSTFKNNNTTFINQHSKNEDINHGIYIDIGPLDYRPNSKILRFIQAIFAMSFSLFNSQRLPNSQGKTLRLLTKIILTLIPFKNIRYYIWKYSEKQMTKYKLEECKYVSEMVIGPKAIKRLLPKEWFTKTKLLKFEGYDMPIPDGAEQWMTMAFGNYMEYPPVEERKPKHKIVLIDTENSYKKYKGKYYCVNNKKED
jgi:lipopolysaccharide cholinephosphotransferase